MTTLSISKSDTGPSLDPPAGAENSAARSGPRALVGRQPILDRALNVVGYELLFRPSTEEAAAPFDGNRATAQVILNTIAEIGLDNVVNGRPAFINFTDEHLISGTAQLLPQQQVVIEVLEDAVVNDELIDALTVLVNAGYTLALDDFVYDSKWDCLLEIASTVKIDILASSSEEIRSIVERSKSLNVKLLAEKVETQEQFDEMFELGFELFQAYFFAKPKVISHAILPPNHISLLRFLATLQDKEATADEIEGLVSQDASLSYKLLRCINSAHFALPQKIDSIRRAVVYFGLDLLRRWACLLAMANIVKRH